jgi:protein-tyrosine phosphatase
MIVGPAGQRMYFFLKPDHGRGRKVSIRHIELQGTLNFRNIGGYETTDGRFVRWGLIYRTGVLTHLQPSDFTYLSQFGIRVVCDFRTHQENEQAAEEWIPDSVAARISLPIGTDDGKNGTASFQQFIESHPDTAQFKQKME